MLVQQLRQVSLKPGTGHLTHLARGSFSLSEITLEQSADAAYDNASSQPHRISSRLSASDAWGAMRRSTKNSTTEAQLACSSMQQTTCQFPAHIPLVSASISGTNVSEGDTAWCGGGGADCGGGGGGGCGGGGGGGGGGGRRGDNSTAANSSGAKRGFGAHKHPSCAQHHSHRHHCRQHDDYDEEDDHDYDSHSGVVYKPVSWANETLLRRERSAFPRHMTTAYDDKEADGDIDSYPSDDDEDDTSDDRSSSYYRMDSEKRIGEGRGGEEDEDGEEEEENWREGKKRTEDCSDSSIEDGDVTRVNQFNRETRKKQTQKQTNSFFYSLHNKGFS